MTCEVATVAPSRPRRAVCRPATDGAPSRARCPSRQRQRRLIADRDELPDREQTQQARDETLAEEQLGRGRHAIGVGLAGTERMKRKSVPEQRQRLNFADRPPHHRRTRLRRQLRPRRRLAIPAIRAEHTPAPRLDPGEHHRLTHERDARQTPAAITHRLANQHCGWLHARELLEIQTQIASSDGVALQVADASRELIRRALRNLGRGELGYQAVDR